MRRHFRKHHAGTVGPGDGHDGLVGTSAAYSTAADVGDHDSSGSLVSSPGDADMELEGDIPALARIAAPPVPSGLPVPAAHYHQWSSSHPEDVAMNEP